MNRLQIRAFAPMWSESIALFARDPGDINRKMAVGVEIIMKEAALGDTAPALCQLSKTEAQALMDSLWDCGVRPTEGAGSAGAMAAVTLHLEDMRTLVFKKEKS